MSGINIPKRAVKTLRMTKELDVLPRQPPQKTWKKLRLSCSVIADHYKRTAEEVGISCGSGETIFATNILGMK